MIPTDEHALLEYARQVALAHLTGKATPVPPDCARTTDCSGVFVTIRRSGALRGCIGRFSDLCPIAHLLAEVTESALHDPRFVDDPVTLAELPDCDIEISVLGSRVDAPHPEQLQAGVHGVVIARGGRTGCFLPQVASERGWSIETFLSECCRQKVGLPADAWRDPATRVQAFEVTVLQHHTAPGFLA